MARDPEPTHVIVSGYGIVFTNTIEFIRGEDEPADAASLTDTEWDQLCKGIQDTHGVEVVEYEPSVELEDDPDGPVLMMYVVGSVVAQDVGKPLRELPPFDGSWPAKITGALDMLRSKHEAIAAFIEREPEANLRPQRFVIVEEEDEDDDG